MPWRDGAFMFQRRRYWVNPAPHVRWVMAPMMLALTYLLQLTSKEDHDRSQTAERDA